MHKIQKNAHPHSLQETFNSLSLSQDGRDVSSDYEYVLRSRQVALKYFFTLFDKPIHILSEEHQKESIKNIPIVCSYADMEFKMSPVIHQDWIGRLSQPNINMGYTMFGDSTKQIILQRLKKNVYSGCKGDDLVVINSMLTLYHFVVSQLTAPEDKILIFTPTYYRFLFTLNQQKRTIVEYELQTRRTSQDQLEFFIDFQQLNKLFESNKIKLIVFANPHNPAGKIWKKEELRQIARLIKKHDCLVFSDDIFCECVQNPSQDYTSLLQFEEIHQNLIWASSFGKAFNCSGNSFSYAIVPNQTIREKFQYAKIKLALFPKIGQMKLLESCFTVGEDWRLKTIHYIRQNYSLLKRQLKKRQLNIGISTLDSAFLVVLDFQFYNWPHTQIKNRLQAQNIFPTYLDSCYVNRQKESISCVRINIAMNSQILMELIERIEKVVKKPTDETH